MTPANVHRALPACIAAAELTGCGEGGGAVAAAAEVVDLDVDLDVLPELGTT